MNEVRQFNKNIFSNLIYNLICNKASAKIHDCKHTSTDKTLPIKNDKLNQFNTFIALS